jgi:hypothetical protein
MLRSLPGCVSLGLVLVVLSAPANGQRLEDGERKFESSKEYKDSKVLRRQLARGEVTADPRDKDHQQAIEVMAKEHVYGLHWTADKSFKSGEINKVVDYFTQQLSSMSANKIREKTAMAQQMFCRAVIDRCKETMPRSKPIVAVNLAMMLSRISDRRGERGLILTEKEWAEDVLPRLADGNGEHLAAVCVEILEAERSKDDKPKNKDEKGNNGVRYYLFRALAGAMGVPSKAPLLKAQTEEKAVALALGIINKEPKFARNTPPGEIEGYKVLRREAVKVVAGSRAATVGEKGQSALALARVAAGDERIKPAPRLDERMEAAMGLCRLIAQANKSPGFQADYAVPCVVRAVYAFGLQANPNLDKKSVERARPWTVDAARLIEAIEVMKGDGKDKYTAAAAKQCIDILTPIMKDSASTRIADLNEWLKTNVPTSKSIYRADENSTVKPAEESED